MTGNTVTIFVLRASILLLICQTSLKLKMHNKLNLNTLNKFSENKKQQTKLKLSK
jgi:hypothetical protein